MSKLVIVYFFPLISFIVCGIITVERKQIVDNGGYIIRNPAVTCDEPDCDLVLGTNPQLVEGELTNATFQVNEGARNQKWGIQYFGSNTASISPGLNRNNTVSLYQPSGWSTLFEKQYTFQNCYGNEYFMVRNVESGLCLGAVSDGQKFVAWFVDCDNEQGNILWTFERYG